MPFRPAHRFVFATQVFDQRAAGLNRIHKEVENAQIETSCHKMLLETETAAIPRRVADAEAAAAAEAEAEELLQVCACVCVCVCVCWRCSAFGVRTGR